MSRLITNPCLNNEKQNIGINSGYCLYLHDAYIQIPQANRASSDMLHGAQRKTLSVFGAYIVQRAAPGAPLETTCVFLVSDVLSKLAAYAHLCIQDALKHVLRLELSSACACGSTPAAISDLTIAPTSLPLTSLQRTNRSHESRILSRSTASAGVIRRSSQFAKKVDHEVAEKYKRSRIQILADLRSKFEKQLSKHRKKSRRTLRAWRTAARKAKSSSSSGSSSSAAP